jgi:hypothetical protein
VFQPSLLFTDHNFSVQTLNNFGEIMKIISTAFPDVEERSTAFLKYVSDNHPSLVSANMPNEIYRRLGKTMSRLKLPVFELEKAGDLAQDSGDRCAEQSLMGKLKKLLWRE